VWPHSPNRSPRDSMSPSLKLYCSLLVRSSARLSTVRRLGTNNWKLSKNLPMVTRASGVGKVACSQARASGDGALPSVSPGNRVCANFGIPRMPPRSFGQILTGNDWNLNLGLDNFSHPWSESRTTRMLCSGQFQPCCSKSELRPTGTLTLS